MHRSDLGLILIVLGGSLYIVLQVSGTWRARTGVLLSRHIGFTALFQTLPLGQQTKQLHVSAYSGHLP